MRLTVKTLLGVLVIAGSVSLNLYLFRTSLSYYREMMKTMLDPFGLSAYDQEAPNPDHGQRFVVVGDSRAGAWPKPQTLSSVEFINRGMSGQTTAQILGRFQRHVADLEPDIVMIQAGINDLKAIPLFPDRKTDIIDDCKQNVAKLVRRSLDAGATVVVTTIIPAGDLPFARLPFWSADVDKAVQECNASILNLQTERVIVLDTSAVVGDGNGRVLKTYQQNFLHLNPAGYAALNQELSRALQVLN